MIPVVVGVLLSKASHIQGGGGGCHINTVHVYVPAFWGTFSRNLVKRSVGFNQRRMSLNYINQVYFKQVIVKTPNLGKISRFSIENGILVGN